MSARQPIHQSRRKDAPGRTDADRLRALLERIGRSQRGAAREIGIDERTMRRYAAGDLPLPRTVWYALLWLSVRDHLPWRGPRPDVQGGEG